jgi:hypothetical protein
MSRLRWRRWGSSFIFIDYDAARDERACTGDLATGMPELSNQGRSPITEGAGKAGHRLMPVARVRKKMHAAVTTGSAGMTGLPCAMVLTVSFVLSPGTGSLAPVTCETCRRLRKFSASTGAPGPHDFSVRAGASRLPAPSRPSRPAPNVS